MNEKLELALTGLLANYIRLSESYWSIGKELNALGDDIGSAYCLAKGNHTQGVVADFVLTLLPAMGVTNDDLHIQEAGISLAYLEARWHELTAKLATETPAVIPMPGVTVDPEDPDATIHPHWPLATCGTCGWRGRRMAGSPDPCPGSHEVFNTYTGASLGWDHPFTPAEDER